MKVAVASKDGISINLHFGHAKQFYIYEVSRTWLGFVEARDVDHYCHGQYGDDDAMAKILQTIQDCQYCFVAKIGEGPKQKLANIGVTAIDEFAYEAIEPSVKQCFERESCDA